MTRAVSGLLKKVELGAHRHSRGKLGFVVLAMEQTVEEDLYRAIPQGFGVHFSRIPMSNNIGSETLISSSRDLGRAVELLLPEEQIDVAAYTCSAATLLIGENKTLAAMKSSGRAKQCTTAPGACIRALNAIGARKLAVIAPYPDFVNDALLALLADKGFSTVQFASLQLSTNMEIDTVQPDYLMRLGGALLAEAQEAEALYICCGALRSVEVIEKLEQATGRPVVTSNQALVWDSLRLCGAQDKIQGLGQLLVRH